MRALLGCLAVVLLACLGSPAAAAPTTKDTVPKLEKKLIEYGWDVSDPAFIRANIRQMEQRPFDGVIFRLSGPLTPVFEEKFWAPHRFDKDYADLAAIKWRRFKYNFIMMWAASNQDWFNDTHWKAIEQHVRMYAKAARIGRCVGLAWDPEPYGPNPWAYTTALHKDKKTFAEYEAMARRRGAQFIRAIKAEMPKFELLTLFQLCYFPHLCRAMDPAERAEKLSQEGYALLPAFLMGMLDEAGSDVVIHDGNENAYYYTDSRHHLSAYHLMKQAALLLVDPGMWERYRRQVKAAQALYIDQYFGLRENTKTYGNYMTEEERAKWFEHNCYYALATTDEYVWCYSEQMNWWTNDRIPPGCEEAIRSARRKLESGEGLGFDLAPIIRAAEERARAELESRLVRRQAEISGLPASVAPPVIDGALDDETWRQVTPLDPFVRLAAQADRGPAAETLAWATYDDKNLYIAFRCAEPEPKKMTLVGRSRDDPVWAGDDVEFLVRLPNSDTSFYHFMINPAGVLWDGLHYSDTPDLSWDPDWTAAAKIGENFWSAEMAIPWATLEMSAPTPGTQLHVNLCRARPGPGELTAWSGMAMGFLEPRYFGAWTFR
ncbi:MAG: hypothetical protein N2512_09950 [Armatimonadetes bacterium]|nr:hypothetical protein [Armatimonadota bacterium]